MDSHLKERIVGAAVLVALGVWLIPWVLDGRDEAPAVPDEPGLELPSPDTALGVRTETVEIGLRRPPPDAAASVAASPGRAAEEVAATAAEAANSAPATATAAAATTATAVTAAAPTAAAPTAVATTAAATTAAPTTVAAASPSGAFSVQVGAFGERPNAVQLAGRIADFGYEARVSEFLSGGQVMHRVRIEGFATRAQAEAASSSLSAHGFPARVMTD